MNERFMYITFIMMNVLWVITLGAIMFAREDIRVARQEIRVQEEFVRERISHYEAINDMLQNEVRTSREHNAAIIEIMSDWSRILLEKE
jgi:hypothetical protein